MNTIALKKSGPDFLGMAAAIAAMNAYPDRDYTFANSKGELARYSFPALGELCRRLGSGLLDSGFLPGERIAIVSREPFDSVRCLFAAFAAGLVPVLVYPPNMLGDNAAYFAHLQAQLQSVSVSGLIIDEESLRLIGDKFSASVLAPRIVPSTALVESDPGQLPDPSHQHPDDPALLQFTSGSGSLSKAVVVTHENLSRNSRAILVDGLSIGPSDRAVCWLPLYHDMGLIGHVIAPAREGLSVTLFPTTAFLKRPGIWMKALSEHRGTITFAPNFAYGLAARIKPAPNLDLSHVRVLGCGAEPIHAETIRNFLKTCEPFGLNPQAIFPCYGLAEHTLAAAFPRVGAGLRIERIDREKYQTESIAVPDESGSDCLEFVECGSAFPGHALRIQAPGSDQVLPDGAIGEIVAEGPSVAAGYFNREEESRAAFAGCTLRTGDMGYLRNGRLFVTGRIKDIMIVNGRNYDPHHVEYIVEQIPEVRAGSAFSFSVPGPSTERIVILYENRAFPTEPIDHAIKAAVSQSLGITPFAVLPRKAHSLPKTTSGKKKRRLAREQYLASQREEPSSS